MTTNTRRVVSLHRTAFPTASVAPFRPPVLPLPAIMPVCCRLSTSLFRSGCPMHDVHDGCIHVEARLSATRNTAEKKPIHLSLAS